MKGTSIIFGLAFFVLTACNENKMNPKEMLTETTNKQTFDSGYSDVNGLKMYYEIYGQGKRATLGPSMIFILQKKTP